MSDVDPLPLEGDDGDDGGGMITVDEPTRARDPRLLAASLRKYTTSSMPQFRPYDTIARSVAISSRSAGSCWNTRS
jgi:hypothetical protein